MRSVSVDLGKSFLSPSINFPCLPPKLLVLHAFFPLMHELTAELYPRLSYTSIYHSIVPQQAQFPEDNSV